MIDIIKPSLEVIRRFKRQFPDALLPQFVIGFTEQGDELPFIDHSESKDESFLNCAVFRAAFHIYKIKSYTVVWKSKVAIAELNYDDWSPIVVSFPAEGKPEMRVFKETKTGFTELVMNSLKRSDTLLGASYRNLLKQSKAMPELAPGPALDALTTAIDFMRFRDKKDAPKGSTTEDKMNRAFADWVAKNGKLS